MLFWGVRGLSYSRFLMVDLVGCAIWAAILCTVGYAGSSGVAVLVGEVKRVELWLLGMGLASAVAFVAGRFLYRRKRRRA